MFTEAELDYLLIPSKFGPNYVEVECGCTLRQFGETFGKFRAYLNGRVEIDCCCVNGCPYVKVSPVSFVRHLCKSTTVDTWRQHIWVRDKSGNRRKLENTNLLRYHVQTFQRPLRPYVHRDEFISCSKCHKERRFHLRTIEQCKIYHWASLEKEWQCSDTIELNLSCEVAEERKARRPSRGCPRMPKCKGCIRCVCTGCRMCRFDDCNCRICMDYVQNEWHA